jgi:hypothetical protein
MNFKNINNKLKVIQRVLIRDNCKMKFIGYDKYEY